MVQSYMRNTAIRSRYVVIDYSKNTKLWYNGCIMAAYVFNYDLVDEINRVMLGIYLSHLA